MTKTVLKSCSKLLGNMACGLQRSSVTTKACMGWLRITTSVQMISCLCCLQPWLHQLLHRETRCHRTQQLVCIDGRSSITITLVSVQMVSKHCCKCTEHATILAPDESLIARSGCINDKQCLTSCQLLHHNRPQQAVKRPTQQDLHYAVAQHNTPSRQESAGLPPHLHRW